MLEKPDIVLIIALSVSWSCTGTSRASSAISARVLYDANSGNIVGCAERDVNNADKFCCTALHSIAVFSVLGHGCLCISSSCDTAVLSR